MFRSIIPTWPNTLALLARYGADVFYRGEIASDILAAIGQSPIDPDANMSLEDLNLYEAVYRMPAKVDFRGYEVWGTVTPTAGMLYLGLGLNILSQLPESLAGGWGQATSLQAVLNALSLATVDSFSFASDQDWVASPWQGLLATSYARNRSALVNFTRGIANASAGDPGAFDPFAAPSAKARKSYRSIEDYAVPAKTTHYSIVDSQSNMIAVTTTLSSFWGSGLVVPGRGFLLNNMNADNDFPPDSYQRGRRQRKTALAPFQFSLGAQRGAFPLCPTIVVKHGQPVLALGTPGSQFICGNVMTTLLNIVAFNMSLQQAVEAPRYNSFNDGTWLFEADLFGDEALMGAMTRVGMNVRNLSAMGLSAIGDVNVVSRSEQGRVDAFADARRDGRASLL